jgi:hypothetical protein
METSINARVQTRLCYRSIWLEVEIALQLLVEASLTEFQQNPRGSMWDSWKSKSIV